MDYGKSGWYSCLRFIALYNQGLHKTDYQAQSKTARRALKARLAVLDWQKVCGA